MATPVRVALAVEPLGGGRYQVACGGSCGRDGVHVVTIGADVVACDCPAGAFGRACKHVAAVTRHLMLAPLEMAPAAGPGLERDVPVPDDQADGAA